MCPVEKAALRTQFRAARLALSDTKRAEASVAIGARVLALPEVAAARVVSVYWPAPGRGEVDTRSLIAALGVRGTKVALPVVTLGPGDERRLVHRHFEGEASLVPNRWGLLEPGPYASAVEPDDLDVVLVPALGAGRNGHRVGYGAGYYDRFLPTTDAFSVALVFAACLVADIPPEPHDVRVACVATEHEALRIG